MLALGVFALAQAQPGNGDNRPFDRRDDQRNDERYDPRNDRDFDQRNDQRNDQFDFDKGYDKKKFITETNDFFDRGGRYNDRFYMERKRDMMIDRINREYDYRIQRVKRDFYLTWYEKQRKIRFLENQRRWEISMVFEKCNGYNSYWKHDRYRDRDDRSFRRY